MPPPADNTSTRRSSIVNATLIALNPMVTKAYVRRLAHQGEDTGWGAA